MTTEHHIHDLQADDPPGCECCEAHGVILYFVPPDAWICPACIAVLRTSRVAGRTACYIGETVRVEISDAIDDCIVITTGTVEDGDRHILEVTRFEAREIIAGLAAVL